MNNHIDPYQLRKMTDQELCEWIAGWNDQRGIGHRLLGQHELERRFQQPNAIRSWLAIGISVIVLATTIALHFHKVLS
jgi:hypothetical protein